MDLHKDDTRAILNYMGFAVNSAYKFKMRDNERTASASIDPKNGRISDFGSGWRGDIIAFYKEIHACSDREAFKEIAKITNELGINADINTSKYENAKFSNFNTASAQNNSQNLTPISQNEIDLYAKERKENFARFSELLARTLPVADNATRRELAQKFEIGYSKKEDRLIMPIRDIKGDIVTLWTYNPSPVPFMAKDGNVIVPSKYSFLAGRPRAMFNIEGLKEYSKNKNEPIFIAEGEKDCLNMLSRGYHAITFGSAGAHVKDEYLSMLKDSYVVIAFDYDEAGKNGATKLAEQLKGVCKEVEIIDWEKITKQLRKSEKLFKGFDFTDYLEKVVNNSEIIKDITNARK